jgi:hypothetical protein
MALTGTVTLIDSFNSTVSKRYDMEATTLSQALTDMTALVADLEAVTDLGVVSVTFSQKDVSLESAAGADSNIDVGATFRVRLDNGKVAAHKVPGFPQSKVSSDRNIDVADADVAAYFANFEAAGAFKISETNVITAVLSGKLDK